MMSNIRSKNTKPEIAVRKFLWAHGFRFRIHKRELPGSPDIVLAKWKVALFVHGCFWHRHYACNKATTPTTNAEKWRAKFESNLARDRYAISKLNEMGWRVIVMWECGIKDSTLDLNWLIDAITTSHTPFSEWPNLQGSH